MFETTIPSSQTVFFCATCNKEFGADEQGRIGIRFVCPSPDGVNHVTAVVRVPAGKKWLHFEKWILSLAERSPLKFFGRGVNAGLYHFVRFSLLAGGLVLASPGSVSRSTVAVLVSAYFLMDLIVVSTAATFISRNPSHPLRTISLTFSTLVQIATSFATFYWVASAGIEGLNRRFDALYYSFVTITTLGYGDIHPKAEAVIPQLLVMFELMFGLYVLAALLAVVAGWSNSMPLARKTPSLAELQKLETTK